MATPIPGVKQQYKVKAKLDISGMKVGLNHFCSLLCSQLSDFVCYNVVVRIILQTVLNVHMVLISSDKRLFSGIYTLFMQLFIILFKTVQP